MHANTLQVSHICAIFSTQEVAHSGVTERRIKFIGIVTMEICVVIASTGHVELGCVKVVECCKRLLSCGNESCKVLVLFGYLVTFSNKQSVTFKTSPHFPVSLLT